MIRLIGVIVAWSRADKINGIVAGAALITAVVAVYPVATDAIAKSQRTEAHITSPRDEQRINGITVPVEGTSEDVPKDSDVWLLIRISTGMWFPVEKCTISNDGTWSFREEDVHLGLKNEPGEYQLALFLVDPSQTGQLRGYVNLREKGKDPGMASLPIGADLLHSITVYRNT